VLDALEVQRAILAGHSFAGHEMTRFASEHPDRLAGLIYIDAAHDHTMTPGFDKVCPPFDAAMMEAFNKTFKNPDLVTGTQLRTGPDGVPRPFASPSALEQMGAGLPSPDYAGVGVPALGIYYVPQRIDEMAPGTTPSPACRALLQRYVYGGIAAFADGVQRATVVALQNSQHNLHWASPDEVAAAMERWLADLPERR
jgi:pimeloyl-ACP methyl ester carboxylesterase